MAKTEEKKDIKSTIDRLNKEYGINTVIAGNQKACELDVVSTGSLLLDIATGVGGFPYGRIVEIIGPESSGKTTLCGHIVANAQKTGKKCAYLDMEHAVDMSYLKKLGVVAEDLIISQPDYGEQCLKVAEELIKTGEVGVVIVDSVATLVPKTEVDAGVGDSKMAGLGRLMSQALRVLSPLVEKNNVLLIFTNQIRLQPGVMYGSPEKPAGGESLKFYASIRLDMRKTPDVENQLNKTRIKIIKSKVAPPFGSCEVKIIWGKGFSWRAELLEAAVEFGIIQKAGSWFSYKEQKIGQGMSSVEEMADNNPEWLQEVEKLTLEKIKAAQV